MIKTTLFLLLISTAAIPKEELRIDQKVNLILPKYPCSVMWNMTGYKVQGKRITVFCQSGEHKHERIYFR